MVLAVALATLLIYPLVGVAPAVSTGVVYLVAVLLVSTYGGLWLGLLAAVASAATFNWFHIEPTGRFHVADEQNWVALAVFLAAAVIASSVAELARSRSAALQELLSAALERERLQAEVVETQALRRSDEMKTAVLRTVSHDLRSPLTAIVTAGDALRSPTVQPDEREELASVIVEEAGRLSRLVEQLLDLSRLQAGTAEPHRDWCSIEEVVSSAIEHLDQRDGDVAIDVAIDPELPFVEADPAQLERVFVNLLDNARRYCGGQPVRVRARAENAHVAILVADRGPGIPAAELPHVFEPFRRGQEPTDHPGSGLGLAIVKGLVEANGGTVSAESAPGTGTAFSVEFPVRA